MRYRAGLLALSMLAPASASAVADDSHWRLFIADHAAPEVRAIEFESGREAGTFDIEGQASLVASKSGRTVFAVQGDVGIVSVIDTGIRLEDHGDHQDLQVSEPRLLESTMRGEKPAHLVEHDRRIALFHDGDGRVDLLTEEAARGSGDAARSIVADAPHHGLAVPMGENVLLSVSNNGEAGRPRAIKVVDAAGRQVGELQDCPGLHGIAASGGTVAIGCSPGVLLARSGTDGPSFELLDYPADFPEGSTSTLRGGVAFRYFLGNYGRDAVTIITPDEDEKFRLVRLDTRRVDFAVDPIRSRNAYILTEDGALHLLNVLSGRIEKSIKLTEPYSMDGHWRDPRPRLAVAGDAVVVTDPRKGLVRVVEIEAFKEVRTIPVKGVPVGIVAAGASGIVH